MYIIDFSNVEGSKVFTCSFFVIMNIFFLLPSKLHIDNTRLTFYDHNEDGAGRIPTLPPLIYPLIIVLCNETSHYV